MGIALHYDFLTTPSLTGHDTAGLASTTPDLSITRATKATVVKSDGLIHEVSAGVARFTGATYSGDTASGTSTKGLLVEEARTNICLQSEDFSTTWTIAAGASVSTNQTAAPDGTSTADELVEDTSGPGGHAIEQIITNSSTVAHAFSIFLKANTRTWALVYIDGENEGVYFDLSNGVTGTVLGSPDDYGIEEYANGWYRCWIVVTETDTNINAQIYLSDGDNGFSYTGDGSSSIYMWGAQVEVGGFPTSYIPTTTASVTRNAEDIKVEGASFGYSTDGGSAYVKATPNTVTHSSAQKWLFTLFADANNYLSALFTDANTLTRGRASGALDSAFDLLPLWAAGVESQLASGWSIDDIVGYFDGSAYSNQVTTGFPALPSGIDSIRIGSDFNGANQLNGHIAEIAYIDVREPNSLLSDLSDGTVTLAEQYGSDTIIERRRRAHYKRQKLRAQGFKGRETWAGSYRGRRIR